MNYKERFKKSYESGLLKASEVMAILNISRSTIARMEKRGELVPLHIGGCLRFKVADVERMINPA